MSSISPPSPVLRGGLDKPVVRLQCPADDDQSRCELLRFEGDG